MNRRQVYAVADRVQLLALWALAVLAGSVGTCMLLMSALDLGALLYR